MFPWRSRTSSFINACNPDIFLILGLVAGDRRKAWCGRDEKQNILPHPSTHL
jgi:hypothetical protein